jgi:hypothetical protein
MEAVELAGMVLQFAPTLFFTEELFSESVSALVRAQHFKWSYFARLSFLLLLLQLICIIYLVAGIMTPILGCFLNSRLHLRFPGVLLSSVCLEVSCLLLYEIGVASLHAMER